MAGATRLSWSGGCGIVPCGHKGTACGPSMRKFILYMCSNGDSKADLIKITEQSERNPNIHYDKAGRGKSGWTRTKIRVIQN